MRPCIFAVAFIGLCTSTGALAQWVLPIEGRPVTAKDISGKKICWDSGHWILFGRDGSFTNDRGKHNRWSVPEQGVIKTGYGEHQVDLQPDGQFHTHKFIVYRGKKGRDIDHWGRVCN